MCVPVIELVEASVFLDNGHKVQVRYLVEGRGPSLYLYIIDHLIIYLLISHLVEGRGSCCWMVQVSKLTWEG